jgi:hypothetical protein
MFGSRIWAIRPRLAGAFDLDGRDALAATIARPIDGARAPELEG